MRRKPTFAPYIGSISSGTMRPGDLVPTFSSVLADLLRRCRVSRATRKEHVRLIHEAKIDSDTLDELFTALEEYAPPYCSFGASEGDGADYGFWPTIDMRGDELPRSPKHGQEAWEREHWGEDVLLVNDHGNVTCGRYDRRGRFHEYWSCV